MGSDDKEGIPADGGDSHDFVHPVEHAVEATVGVLLTGLVGDVGEGADDPCVSAKRVGDPGGQERLTGLGGRVAGAGQEPGHFVVFGGAHDEVVGYVDEVPGCDPVGEIHRVGHIAYLIRYDRNAPGHRNSPNDRLRPEQAVEHDRLARPERFYQGLNLRDYRSRRLHIPGEQFDGLWKRNVLFSEDPSHGL